MAWYDTFLSRRGRPPHEPHRDTQIYSRLLTIGNNSVYKKRPLIKATPTNLRRFAKSVYARRAINAIKDPISQLDWKITPKKGVASNSEIARQIETLTDCFTAPNLDDSFSTFLEQIVEDMLVGGAGVFEHQQGGDPIRPLWMWPVDVLTIQIFAAWDGGDGPRYYQSLGGGNVGGQVGLPLRNDELVYAKMNPTTESPFGLGPIEVAFQTINRLLGLSDYAGNVASNALPENLLFFAGLTQDGLDAARIYWQNEIEGHGKTPLLRGDQEDKVTVERLRGGDDKALFLGFREALIREVCAALGISPQNAGIEKDVNRDTAEVAEDRDWRQTIIPMAAKIVAHLNREIIWGRFGYTQIEFGWRGLDREDEEATAKILKMLYETNAITPNEIRERYDMDKSDNQWADMTQADVFVAMNAARGAKQVDDKDLPKSQPAPPPSPKPSNGGGMA